MNSSTNLVYNNNADNMVSNQNKSLHVDQNGNQILYYYYTIKLFVF